MRIATIEVQGASRVVIVDEAGERYWDIADVVPGFAGDMLDLIKATPHPAQQLKPAGPGQPLAGARLKAPLNRLDRNLFLVGKNYHEHAKEFSGSGFDSSAQVVPSAPNVFTKPASTIVGPHDAIESHPAVTQQMDYEAELAVVIGKGGRGIRKEDAYAHVWGYTVVNDVTARDLQKQHGQWFLGKSLDTFCPMGPWIVTADAIDPANTRVQCWVNEELRQDANTADLIFDIPTLIATISAGIELKPGDVIVTGTPVGVGIGFKPPKFLKAGDVVRIAIENIGTIENRVR
ncbi:fumarylacetoacetate hydrolase family protein [Massilia sp. Mn16-1_5]|uniref:fumarylacetoacetate hydrolase family protein n=1 Tax=Massilia sp. Mn16-1_5 TaxID=2079199 RepID=UPI00109EBB32|nr:fumarylacetoacetate hydrolase family protein [Massilia sp. Mn16-1_5]THC43285.1 hydrolase [Massilia sp. Mn16-1_5]